MILLLSGLLLITESPDTLTLDQAYMLARDRFPLENEIALRQDIRDLGIDNLTAGWYPEVSVSGSVQYQSDVTEIEMDLPAAPNGVDFPTQSKDRYQIALDLEQRLYDGGRTRSRKELEHRRSERAVQEVRVRQHDLKNQINEVWFAVNTLRKQQEEFGISLAHLEEQLQEMESQVGHGALPASAHDALQVEKLRLKQQCRILRARERSALNVLSELIDTDVPENVILKLPEIPEQLPVPRYDSRPEAALFEAHRNELEEKEAMVTASYRPAVAAYGQAAYGRPGLDLFEDRFQPWFVVGVRARWSFWNWRTDERERQMLQLNRQIVDNEEDIFRRNVNMVLQEHIEQITELQEVIREDEEIRKLYERIVSNAESQLENGTITASEYIRELSHKRHAGIRREQHRIELAKYWQNYLITSGN